MLVGQRNVCLFCSVCLGHGGGDSEVSNISTCTAAHLNTLSTLSFEDFDLLNQINMSFGAPGGGSINYKPTP